MKALTKNIFDNVYKIIYHGVLFESLNKSKYLQLKIYINNCDQSKYQYKIQLCCAKLRNKTDDHHVELSSAGPRLIGNLHCAMRVGYPPPLPLTCTGDCIRQTKFNTTSGSFRGSEEVPWMLMSTTTNPKGCWCLFETPVVKSNVSFVNWMERFLYWECTELWVYLL